VSTTVVERHEMKIDTEDDIILVRRKVREVAQSCHFDVFAASAVTTAASELARNVWTHAGKGIAVIEQVTDDLRFGVRAKFEDDGPGITDVERALRGGYSTANSMGLGLSGSKRLVDDFSIESAGGRGTKVTFLKWAPF
jgi:serine/threonine-protein kinase RsbT